MVERTFNHAKIVASVARAAGDPEDGISVKLIDALKDTALRRDLSSAERSRAQEMADAFDQHLAQTHVTADHKKIGAQILARPPASQSAIQQAAADIEVPM